MKANYVRIFLFHLCESFSRDKRYIFTFNYCLVIPFYFFFFSFRILFTEYVNAREEVQNLINRPSENSFTSETQIAYDKMFGNKFFTFRRGINILVRWCGGRVRGIFTISRPKSSLQDRRDFSLSKIAITQHILQLPYHPVSAIRRFRVTSASASSSTFFPPFDKAERLTTYQ